MGWLRLQLLSLKARVTLLTLLAFALSLLFLSVYASQLLRHDMQALVGAQQLSTVQVLAQRVEADLQTRLKALEALAAALPADSPADATAWQAQLDQDRLATHLFNRGVFATNADGLALASSPAALGRTGLDYSDRDYIGAALAGHTSIGRPVLGRPKGTPMLLMSTPVRDADGRVQGVLVGVTDLGRSSFLDTITHQGYGQTGDFFVVSRPDRLVVTSSNPQRVMQALPPPGANPAIDRLMQGFSGSLVLVNQHGTEVLNSGTQVAGTNWDVTASLPTEEAFAPARHLQQRVLVAAALLMLALGTLLWWLLRQQLAPAVAAASALAAKAQDSRYPQPLPVTREDEIGALVSAFNGLLTTLAQRDAALRISDLALKSISEAVVFTGADQLVVSANDAHETITGYTSEELLGHNLRLLQGPDTCPASVAALARAIADKRVFQGELLNYRKDGTAFWNDLTVSPVHDSQGRLTHFVGITRDVTERRRIADEASRLAFYDPLTQLPNRRLLKDRLSQAQSASSRSGLHGAVMFIDLDGFKPLNDEHGHDAGDLLLVQAADRLRACVRESDTVARMGGDEFVVILAALSADVGSSTEQARGIAEKVRATLAAPYTLSTFRHTQRQDGDTAQTSTLEYRCSASIGVTLFRNADRDIDDLLRLADMAMYQAKQAGRDTVRFHHALA